MLTRKHLMSAHIPPEVLVPRLLLPAHSLPRLGAGCSWHPMRKLRHQPQAEMAIPVGWLPVVSNQGLTAALSSPKSLPYVTISMLPLYIETHTPLYKYVEIYLFKLTPFLF